ncbi:MAG: universal stress protein [Cytophagales bacterium]|nr:universal stress protein [Cytophagales bacterium]
MQELRNILICTDFSKDATNALVYAINLAEQINAHLYILHVKSGEKPMDDAQVEDHFEQVKHDFLFRRTLRISYLIREGDTREEIKQAAQEKHIDLIVLGMKGASGQHEMEFGSITAHLIDDPVCSILSVPGDCRILTVKQVAVANDNLTPPDKTELYVLSYLSEAFSPKIHIFNVKKQAVEVETATSSQDLFDDIFKYNLHTYYDIDKPNVIGSIRDFINENNIDLLVVFHRVSTQKDPFKRSVSKQLVFSLKLPLLITPIKN